MQAKQQQASSNLNLLNDPITRCEVCGNDELNEILNLGKQPLIDDLIPIGNNSITLNFPIEILY